VQLWLQSKIEIFQTKIEGKMQLKLQRKGAKALASTDTEGKSISQADSL
jgi:hypothetical protein